MTRPRPVMTAAGVSGLITSLAGVVAWLGYVAPAADLSDRADTIGSIVVGAVALGSHLLAGLHAQSKVTPVALPQDHDGTPLVRDPAARPMIHVYREDGSLAAVLGAPEGDDVEPMDD